MRHALALACLVALTLVVASAARAQGDGQRLALALAAATQSGEQRAGLVVQYGDGSVQTACVQFAEEQISGIDLLVRSGLPVITQSGGVGAAVCKIGPDGCDYPAEGCFCKRDGARSIYWAFYTLQGGAWAYSALGAANTRVGDGDVHGWAWGLGESGSGAQPPVQSIDAVCGSAAPAASETLAPPATMARTAAPATEAAAAPTTALLVATETPVAAGGAAEPAATGGEATGGGLSSLIGFAAIALVLVAGVAFAARRRTSRQGN